MIRDRYYKTPDGYDAYQHRELLKREIKDGKVYSTYKCSNMGGEVDIFTTVFPIIEKEKLLLDKLDKTTVSHIEIEKSSFDKVLDSIEDHWSLFVFMALFINTMIVMISFLLK